MNSVPEGPFFVSRDTAETAGVDFLALGAVGEGLVAAGLPGITNVTRYLRPYTFASWIAWRFDQDLKELSARRLPLPAPTKRLFKAFREKAELLFTWCNRSAPGAVGNSRRYPTDASLVRLAFDNDVFGPVNLASWFAAALYGPSFSVTNGLGFIYSHDGAQLPTVLGEKAARILDDLMAQHPEAHAHIAHLTDHQCSLNDVHELTNALALRETTAEERALFRSAFYQESLIGTSDGTHGSRATSIHLIERALQESSELDVEQIRQSIALGLTPQGKSIVTTALERMRRLWFVVSLRQPQRIALERLLRWLEFQLVGPRRDWYDISVLCGKLVKDLEEAWPEATTHSVGAHIDRQKEAVEQKGGVQVAPLIDDQLSQFKIRRDLEKAPDSEHKDIPAKSVQALLHCVAITELCGANNELIPMLRMGGRERVSLASLGQFAESRRSMSISRFAQDVLTHLVYAQHLQTAASRVEEGKNKFRFAVDEDGLRPLISPTGINGQLGTPDRLQHALYLMEECAMVRSSENRKYALT